MVHNNSNKNFDLLEAYKSVYTEQPCTLDKELVDPPADPQGEMGSYGPKGAPKKPHGGDHARITGESEPKRKGRYRAAYEEYKKELASQYMHQFNEWVQSLADEGYDITKWETKELLETYVQENNLWESGDIISEISAQLALTASQKAGEMRRKAAIAGDTETAAKKASQASRLYKGVGPRRAKERTQQNASYEPEGQVVNEEPADRANDERLMRDGLSAGRGSSRPQKPAKPMSDAERKAADDRRREVSRQAIASVMAAHGGPQNFIQSKKKS